jgi:4-diphosphocytidyl-2-C-methyl-D-erythritol kinase
MHEVATILQTISLADRLRLTLAEDLTLACYGMPSEPDNLILRAAHLLREHAGFRSGCAIECWKRIPVGAGLGGGSVDAAATLAALNVLWSIRATRAELVELARTLGADVPFGLTGGTALATGVGATIEPLPDAPRHWLVLVPIESGEATKTADMYRSLTPEDYSDGQRTGRLTATLASGRVPYAEVQSAFTRAACERWPAVSRALDDLARANPLAACVSGAGPSVFGLYASRAAARSARDALGAPARVLRFVASAESSTPRLTLTRQWANTPREDSK